MNVRVDRGHWKLQRKTALFLFLKTSEGGYPSWKDEVIAEKGEAAAELILAATPKRYSYKVDVAL